MKNRPIMGIALSVMPVAFLAVFIGIPLVLSVAYTLGDIGGINSAISQTALHQIAAKHGVTLAVFSLLLKSTQFRSDLWVTVWITALSVLVTVLLCWAIALYTRFSHSRLGRLASVMYIVPMFIPGVIAAYALVSFYNHGGFLSALAAHLGIAHLPVPGYTSMGVVVAFVWSGIPFGTLLISSGLRSIDDSLIEAAKDIGASWWSVFTRVIVPMNMLPTAIVATFGIIGNIGSFTIPFLMGPTAPQMLGVLMYNSFSAYDQPQDAEAMAIAMFIVALVVGYAYIRVNLRQERRKGSV